jgi:YVTN family beta-propeller protein
MRPLRIWIAVIAVLTVLVVAGLPFPTRAASTTTRTNSGFGVSKTVLLYNDSIQTGVSSLPQGGAPTQLVWDAKTGHVFVATTSGVIVAFDPSTNSLLGAFYVGHPLAGLTVDSKANRLYVSEPTADQVAVLNETSGAIVARIGVGTTPYGILFNPILNRVYVANFGGHNLTVIDPATNKVTRSIPGLSAPLWLALDSTNGHIFVANRPASCTTGPPPSLCSLSDVNASTHLVLWNLTKPLIGQMAFDPANGDVYAPELGNGTVSVVNEASGKTVAMVHTGPAGGGEYPIAAALDPANGRIYVINEFAANFTVINGSTNRMVQSTLRTWQTMVDSLVFDAKTGQLCGSDDSGNYVASPSLVEYAPPTLAIAANLALATQPWGAVYNSFNTKLYVADVASGGAYVLNGSTGTTSSRLASSGIQGASLAVNPSNGSVFLPTGSGILTLSATGRVTSLKDPYQPNWLTYDSATGDLYAGNSAPEGVSIIHVATNQLIGTFHYAGWSVSGLAYDSLNGHVYAPMWSGSAASYSDKIFDINGTTKRAAGNLTVPSSVGNLTGPATFDPRTGTIWVANSDLSGSNTLLAISVTTRSLVGIVQLGGFVTHGVTFDGANGFLYATLEDNFGGGELAKVSASNYSVVSSVTLSNSSYATSVTVDAHTGQIWVSSLFSGQLFLVRP